MSFRRKSPRSRSLQDEVTRGGREGNPPKREVWRNEKRSPGRVNEEKLRRRRVTRDGVRDQHSSPSSRARKNSHYSELKSNQEIEVYNPKTARYEKVSVGNGYGNRVVAGNRNERVGWSTFKKVAVGLCALLFVFLITVTGILAHYLNRFTGEVQSAAFEPEEVSIAEDFDFQFDKTGYFNVAFIGVTKREGKEELGSRANTVMIASLNYDTGEVRLVSVYRDTLLELEDGSLDLAAHSYAYGGSRGTVAMLNRNLDLNIQHYVTVDFAALALTVNALDGVEVYIMPEEMHHINQLGYQMVSEGEFAPGANLSIPPLVPGAGYQLLCGVQALAYTRIRMVGNNDFQRTERQRHVIERMAYRASDASLGTINEIVNIAFEYLATNFSLTEILAHSRYMGHYQIGETTGFPFDLAMVDLERTGSTVIPATLESNVALLHEFLFGTTNFRPSSTVLNISANIYHATGATEDSAIDIDGDWDMIWPEEGLPWDSDSDTENDSCLGVDDEFYEVPNDLPEEPPEYVPPEPPPDDGDGAQSGG